jgi:hypothetical protein
MLPTGWSVEKVLDIRRFSFYILVVNFSSSRLEYSLLELFGKGFSKSVSYAVLLLLVKNVEPLTKKATEAVAPIFF